MIKRNRRPNTKQTFKPDEHQPNDSHNHVKPQNIRLERQAEGVEKYDGHCQAKRPVDRSANHVQIRGVSIVDERLAMFLFFGRAVLDVSALPE